MKKICFIAPSGYGKSTAIEILKKKYNIANIKIAKPLYDLQDLFYKTINTKMSGEQDGELLQFLGIKIRKENPNFLVETFENYLNNLKNFNGIICNDDCRPPDLDTIKKLGFITIKINGFKHSRVDHTPVDEKKSIEWQEEIKCDYTIENTTSIEQYEINLLNLMEEILC